MNDQLEQAILARLPDAAVDVAVGGSHARIRVVSAAFAGMRKIERHKLVYACINAFIEDGRLHAVDSIQALTPDEQP